MSKRSPVKSAESAPTANPWVHRVAWLLAVVTFPLLWVGGLVTTTKSGMAVPDWPNTYGYNLFLYPWQSWVLGPWDIFVEHSHRLLASLTGVLTIMLLVLLWRFDQRRWMHVVGVIALVAVIAQGVLGGMRVVLDDRLLAMAHGCIGPLFFALTVALVVWTSRTWQTASKFNDAASLRSLIPVSATAATTIYFQLIVGALLRHMPVTASPQAFATTVMAHLFLAAAVVVVTLIIAWQAARAATPRGVRWAAGGFALIVALQVTLGGTTWVAKYGVPLWAERFIGTMNTAIVADGWWQMHIVTAHQATGSLLLAASVVLLLLAARFAPAVAGASLTAANHTTLPARATG